MLVDSSWKGCSFQYQYGDICMSKDVRFHGISYRNNGNLLSNKKK